MRFKTLTKFGFLALFTVTLYHGSQARQVSGDTVESIRIMFYNVENLFDPFNDSLKSDEEYVTGGVKAWNYSKFKTKLVHIAKVIVSAGGWHPPAIIGLCEIENDFVLRQMVTQSPLRKFQYRFIHVESPDPRGVDVALLYQPGVFTPVYHRAVRINFPDDSLTKTRDILYVKGLINADTFHILVNHWPSKFGGSVKSSGRRKYVAGVLQKLLDSIYKVNAGSKIIAMGDFNEGPYEESMKVLMDGIPFMTNLMAGFPPLSGTHKYQGTWTLLDQFIVSRSLVNPQALIFSPGFILEDDENFTGKRPWRTYSGPRYLGGFSDHLPVILEL